MIRLILFVGFTILLDYSDYQAKNKIDNTDHITFNSLTTTKQEDNEMIFDFYHRFSTDNEFQLTRIKFPLTILKDNKTVIVEKKDWKHDDLFFSLGYTTQILDSRSNTIDYRTDFGDKAIFSWIYPLLQKQKDYYFIREKCQWYLSKIVINDQNSEDPNSFIQFLQKFMNDSIFQVSRIKFPIKIDTWTGDEEEARDTTYLVKQSNWRFFSIYNGIDSLTNFSNNWNSSIKPTNQLTLFLGGVENGISVKYYFQRINNTWYLVRLEDDSD